MPRPTALLWFTAAIAAAAPSAAQDADAPCPLGLSWAKAQLARANAQAGLYRAPVADRGGTARIPIVAHIVRRSNGTGGLSQTHLNQSIHDAQDHLAAGGFELCLVETRSINSDTFFSGIDTMDEIDALRTTDPVPGAVNIYFTPNLSSGGSSICGLSSFTFSDTQGIVMRNACTAAGGNTSTLAHEIGHYFDLFHTHENALGIECVDGSNCATNGDQICDTPADPNILGQVSTQCQWFGAGTDPCGSGMPFEPPVLNLMSYSTTACRQEFTPEQLDRMRATRLNIRTELDADLCTPTCTNPADVNADGLLTPADFNAWVLAFNQNLPAADQNGDGQIRPEDFNAWVLNYNTGC